MALKKENLSKTETFPKMYEFENLWFLPHVWKDQVGRGDVDVFLEMITQPFPGFDGIVPDSSNQAAAPRVLNRSATPCLGLEVI